MRAQKIVIGFMIAALLSLAVIAGLIFYANQKPKLGDDFSLLGINGSWKFSDEAKDLNLVYVGYAKCPDVCPLALSYTHSAVSRLSESEKERMRVLFISVDVDHDSKESVTDYAKQFDPTFIGLTGSKEQIEQTLKKIGASYLYQTDPKSYLGYSISHTDRIFFLNKKGIVIDSLPNPRTSDSVLEKMKANL